MTPPFADRLPGDRRRVAHVLGAIALLAVVALFIVVAVPGLVGADHSYVVRSDSMSPAIPAGSVVFVSEVPTADLSKGDVITYRQSPSGGSLRVTHRIVDIVERDGGRRFRTKGDANEEADQRLVSPEQVVGRVVFHLPWVGYAVSFAGSQLGLALLVVVPALVLAVTELRDMFANTTAEETTDDRGEES